MIYYKFKNFTTEMNQKELSEPLLNNTITNEERQKDEAIDLFSPDDQ